MQASLMKGGEVLHSPCSRSLAIVMVRPHGQCEAHCRTQVAERLGHARGVLSARCCQHAPRKMVVHYDPSRTTKQTLLRVMRQAGYDAVAAAG